jgi:hypothetical protein
MAGPCGRRWRRNGVRSVKPDSGQFWTEGGEKQDGSAERRSSVWSMTFFDTTEIKHSRRQMAGKGHRVCGNASRGT